MPPSLEFRDMPHRHHHGHGEVRGAIVDTTLKAYRTDPPREKEPTKIDSIRITYGFLFDLLIASPINRNVKGARNEARRRPLTGGNCWSSSAAAPTTC